MLMDHGTAVTGPVALRCGLFNHFSLLYVTPPPPRPHTRDTHSILIRPLLLLQSRVPTAKLGFSTVDTFGTCAINYDNYFLSKFRYPPTALSVFNVFNAI